MFISETALLAGSFASLLFLIVGWPLAHCLAAIKILLGGLTVQASLAVIVGVVCAPHAEQEFPELDRFVAKIEHFVEREIIDRLSD